MKAKFIELPSVLKKSVIVKEVDQPFLTYPLHYHHLCELVYIVESSGKRIIGDNVGTFSDGDLILMGPNLPHIWNNDTQYFNEEGVKRARAIVVYFHPDFLLQLTDDETTVAPLRKLIEDAIRGICFSGQVKTSTINIIKGLSKKEGLPRIIDVLRIIDQLSSIKNLEYLASERYQPYANKDHIKRINEVYLFLMNNYIKNISVSDVAAVANLTPNAFCRFFKKHAQKTFSRFINELRIGHACNLLAETDLSISEVCYESGYQNLTNFNKFFKLIMKKSAGQYRKEIHLQMTTRSNQSY